jgi:hypothetical protein
MRRLLLWCALAFAAAAQAQEFDTFDDNDFLDPRIRGAEFRSDGRRVRDPGTDFQIMRVATGGISNYTWRSQPTNTNVGFLQLTHSIYRGGYQANFKLTTLQAGSSAALPRYRATTQFARYFLTPIVNRMSKEREQIAGRLLVTASFEENHGRAPGSAAPDYNMEIGAELDAAIPLPRGRSASGSLVWVRRELGEKVGRIQRLTYFYRFADRTYFNRLRMGISAGVGGEKQAEWHWGAARLGVLSSMDMGRLGTMKLTWTPTVLPASSDRRVYQEIGLFVDRTLMKSVNRR